MRVLVACEHTGTVRDAFTNLGHHAVSCDLLPAPGNHHQGDVRDILDQDWDLMIAHPPCTHLAVSGARWTAHYPTRPQIGTRYGLARIAAQRHALDLVQTLLDAPIPHIAVENPISAISTRIRKPDQIIQPWQYGHNAAKTTCLWLIDLPPLRPTQIVRRDRYANQTPTGQNRLGPSATRARQRGRTYPGVAAAMADQWGRP